MNRALSLKSKLTGGGKDDKSAPKHRFTVATIKGTQQPELSKKLYKIIKTENHAISAYETAARERAGIAQQISDWGEATEDDTISDISDKLGVLLAEIAEQEQNYAQGLEDYRGILKQIRNTESSVQPSRDNKAKISDEIAKLKYKEPQSTKIVQLEQELVRAEAQSLVAEAQLSNITRQKFKEAFDIHLAATVERSEKQAIIARHARRLLNLVDDTPVVPGDKQAPFMQNEHARQVLTDAENDLRNYELRIDPIQSSAGSHVGLASSVVSPTGPTSAAPSTIDSTLHAGGAAGQKQNEAVAQIGGDGSIQAPYPVSEAEKAEIQGIAA